MDKVEISTHTRIAGEPVWDSSLRFIFLLSGDMSFFVGTKERRLHAHDFTFIRPFEMYGGSSDNEQGEALMITVKPDLWKNILPGAENMNFSIGILRQNDNIMPYASICRSLAQIIYYSKINEESAPARICTAVSRILAVLTENFASAAPVQKSNDQNMVRIQEILRYISENYTRKLSLEEIAGAIGFHPQYFSTYFKKQFGVSFTDYLNNYRINKSIYMLRDSGESILQIALSCGFNSHKTYSNAFEKYYHCSPREYRKLQTDRRASTDSDPDDNKFDYLWTFWNSSSSSDISITSPEICSVILDTDKPEFENRSHSFASLGRAMSVLRSDMQKQLLRAKHDLDLEYVRMRDVFSDDLFVYYEDSRKTPVFSWRALDEIFDFLISAGLKPFIEIGYMPSQMASRKQYAGWQYHPNVSSPKSAALWELLVTSFITHLISRYGKSVIEGWLFDFWTSPNLQMQHGYWNESIEDFFQFYFNTYKAVKAVDRNIRFGSPNFSYPSGFHHYEAFCKFAKKHRIKPDFISTHLYSCGDGQDTPREKFIEYSVFDNNYLIPNIKPGRNTIPNALSELRAIIGRNGFEGLPVIVDDWNVSFFPTDFTRDTCFMGPLVVENYFNSCRSVYGMGFASLSDIHEDFFNTDQMFSGGPGLLTYSGIPKSSYFAMSMAYRFSRQILKKGNNYIIGKADAGYDILIYNMAFYNDDYAGNDPSVISFTNRYNVFTQVPDLSFHISLPADNAAYSIVRIRIGRKYGSSYDAWVRMGSPSDITPDISEYLNRICTPDMNYQTINCNGNIVLDETVEAHGVLNIRIRKI